MSAETLRRAAALMRARAADATEGRWSVQFIRGEAVPNSHIIDRWFVMGHFASGNPTGPVSTSEYEPDAEHIASWHPAVALAVADLLDGEADHFHHNYPPRRHRDDELDTGLRRALAVARAYLGESA